MKSEREREIRRTTHFRKINLELREILLLAVFVLESKRKKKCLIEFSRRKSKTLGLILQVMKRKIFELNI